MPLPSRKSLMTWILVTVSILGTQQTSADSTTRIEIETIEEVCGLKLARIPAGSFQRCLTRGEQGADQVVTITRDFFFGVHEVTVGQFSAFVEESGYVTEAEKNPQGGWAFQADTGRVAQTPGVCWKNPHFEQTENHPVVQVTWNDGEAFCRWMSHKTGSAYRLPTEAEWEYACRAGSKTSYWFGDDDEGLSKAANVADRSILEALPFVHWAQDWSDGYAYTSPVGSFEANPFGLFDVHGNVWEWCADWWQDFPYPEGDLEDPKGPDEGHFRTIRGGGWFNPPYLNRASARVYFSRTFKHCQLSGFRVVREVD